MLTLRRWTAELVTLLVLLAMAAGLLVMASGLPPSPVKGYPGAAFFPSLALSATGLFLIGGIAVLLLRRRAPAPAALPVAASAATPPAPAFASAPGAADAPETADDGTFRFELRDYIITIAATLAFIYGMDLIGFELSCFLVMAALLWTRMESAVTVIVTAALTMLVLYGTFVLLLNVSMPLLFLPRYLSF